MALIDEAAICMLALSKMPPCIEDEIEEELCRVFCCCKKYPIIKKRRLMQKCADMLLDATRRPGRPYENSVPYRMDTLEPLELDSGSGRRIYRELKALVRDELAGDPMRRQPAKVRIPDVSVYDESGKLDRIYDFKFPGDRWRKGQREAYTQLVGEEEKVTPLNLAHCRCDDRTEDRTRLTEEEKQAAADMANRYFITDWETHKHIILGVMAGVEDQELKELIPELISAVHNAKSLKQKLAPLFDITTWFPLGKWGKLGGRAARARLPRPGFAPAPHP